MTKKTFNKVAPIKGDTFVKTPKQVEAIEILNNYTYSLLYGGGRSGKSFIILRNIFIRALKVKSTHLAVRMRFNHIKNSLWLQTMPKVFELCFPTFKEGQHYELNRQDHYVTFVNGSEFWIGGIDDKDRTDKILGREFSTIYPNECSELSYLAIQKLQTRLAEKTSLTNKMYFDENPPSKKHWSYTYFFEGLNPVDRTPLENVSIGKLQMNPKDNLNNISEHYMEILRTLSKREQERFLNGNFLDDVEGALWTFDMVNKARLKIVTDIRKTVVAVDPAVTHEEGSDLTGIIVASGNWQEAVVDADYSCKASPMEWANKAVNAYYKHHASYIVAEVNQGGDLVETVIKQIDPKIKVVKVHANKGKFARAEPISALYEQGRVSHAEGLDALETEMMEWVPEKTKKSPDRLDAMVYALTDLLLKTNVVPMLRVI